MTGSTPHTAQHGGRIGHVYKEVIPIFRGYCKECKETISFWPEFVLPCQSEPLETHESAVVDHLAGKSYVKTRLENLKTIFGN